MNTYVVFSKLEVLNEAIEHIGERFEAKNLLEASSKAKKFIRFEEIKEFLIVCYEDWAKDPDIGKIKLNTRMGYTRTIKVTIKQDGYHPEDENRYSDS